MAYKESHGIGPILASTQCQFLAPLAYPDRIHIGVRIDEPEGKRLPMHYEVFSEKLGRVAARGEGLVVFYDYNNACSTNIPEALKLKMNALRERQETHDED
jgi:acyl-CoA thioester hydrolase